VIEETKSVSLSTRNDGAGEAQKKKKKLTVSQLSDLYRRLDINGDGELDMGEFVNISNKLKLTASHAVLSDIFRKADTSGGGKLSNIEFIHAYNLLYDYNPDLDVARRNMESHVRAIRYGFDRADGKFVFEVFSGTLQTIYYKTCHYEDGSIKKFHLDRSYKGQMPKSTKHSHQNKEETTDNESYDLRYISKMMEADAKFNKEAGAKIFWWIDISAKEVVPLTFIPYLSLPPSIEPMFYYDVMDNDKDTRVFLSDKSDEIDSATGVNYHKSLTLFVQSMWLANLPMVASLPSILSYLPSFLHGFFKYLMNRMSFFFSYVDVPDYENVTSIVRARDLETVSHSLS
jgi:hypothetical protein